MALKNITLHTHLKTNLQKELEGHESIPRRISDACTYLSSLLKVAYGSKGRAIMVQKQNGQMMITRSGTQILNHVITDKELCNPIYQTIINCARNIESEFGDGIKRFILHTNAICRVLTNDLKHDVYREKLNQLVCIQNAVKLAELEFCGEADMLDLNLSESVINSFLSTRFTAPVRILFTDVSHKWFSCFLVSDKIDISTLKFMHENFSVLCKRDEKPSSISESFVCDGILLKGELIRPPTQTKEFKSVLIVYYLSEAEKRTCKNTEHDLMCILNEELDKNRTHPLLLITNIILSDPVKCFVRLKKLYSLHGVLEEDVLFIHNYLLSYFKSGDGIIDCSLQPSINTLKLSLANVSQLILCSPTIDIGLQLYSSLHNFITLLKYSICNKLLVFGPNNVLLVSLYSSLLSKAVHNNLPSILNRRAILDNWHDSESSNISSLSLDEKSTFHQFVSHSIKTILDSKYMNNSSLILLGEIIFQLINSQEFVDRSERFLDLIPLDLAIFHRSLSAAFKLLSIDRILDAKRLS